MAKAVPCSGRVVSIIYENAGFFVLRVLLDDSSHNGKPVAVRGSFGSLSLGSWISFDGKWEKHPTYGDQIHALRSPASAPGWTLTSCLSALAAQGIGAGTCSLLERSYGKDLPSVLDQGEEALRESGLDDVVMACTTLGASGRPRWPSCADRSIGPMNTASTPSVVAIPAMLSRPSWLSICRITVTGSAGPSRK